MESILWPRNQSKMNALESHALGGNSRYCLTEDYGKGTRDCEVISDTGLCIECFMLLGCAPFPVFLQSELDVGSESAAQ